MEMIFVQFLAANYDCDAYGAGGYNDTSCAADTSGGGTTGGTTGGSNGGGTTAGTTTDTSSPVQQLANTGYDILIPAALAVAIIVAAAIYLVRKVVRS